MPKRRSESHGLAAGVARLASSLVWLSWAKLMRRPVDSLAVLVAGAASLMIVVNALVLQTGARTMPFSAAAMPRPLGTSAGQPKAAVPPASPLYSADTSPAPQRTLARHNDPIAQLIGMSSRIMAVQRVLSEYGYGQIRSSGVLDRPTSAAIEKFEREHKLPVTGRISEPLVSELSAMIGHPLE